MNDDICIPLLDLHGESHDRADYLIEKFITDNIDNLPVKIVTGNSKHFISKTKEYTEKYNLFCYKQMMVNCGCWIVMKSSWF
jgi:hypothetical protein